MPSPIKQPELRTQPELAGNTAPCIGIFDSGVGGLSILQTICQYLPHAKLLYVADTGHAPYGDRNEHFVCDRSKRIAEFLLEHGAQIIVVACNTATAAAAAALRAAWPHLPIVGVEPGVKPAIALSAKRRIGVLATTRTLASDKFRRLIQAHTVDATLIAQPCPGLADAIESVETNDSKLASLVEHYSAPLRNADIDVAVLGCTHYVFARALFEHSLPGVQLIDTADAIARQTARLVTEGSLSGATINSLSQPNKLDGLKLQMWSSGQTEQLATFANRWLGIIINVRSMNA